MIVFFKFQGKVNQLLVPLGCFMLSEYICAYAKKL